MIYVDIAATGLNDGSSWTNAFTSLQDALGVAVGGDAIWVSSGTYRPDQGSNQLIGDRDASFTITDRVSLFGGFAGNESDRGQRDWITNATILSGDLMENDSGLNRPENPLKYDNSRHVVRVDSPQNQVTLDGFYISSGFADGQANTGGSAILFQNLAVPGGLLRVRNCYISGNTGTRGTVAIIGSSFSPDLSFVLEDSRLEDNWADFAGGLDVSASTISIERTLVNGNEALEVGALYMASSTAYISGSTISFNESTSGGAVFVEGENEGLISIWSSRIVGNRSTATGAGALTLSESHLESVNSVYSGNSAGREGGAFHLANYSARIVNSVFAFNTAGVRGGAIASFDKQSTTITNSIMWENHAPDSPHYYSFGEDTIRVFSSIATGGVNPDIIDEGAFWDVDPLFANPKGPDQLEGTIDDDFQVMLQSPAIDSGDNTRLLPDILDLDLDGNVFESFSADILGNVRVVDGGTGVLSIDIGPYEYGATPVGIELDWRSNSSRPGQPPLAIFPNPARSVINVDWGHGSQESRFVLYDLLGRRVKVIFTGATNDGDRLVFEVSHLSRGVYILREDLSGITSQVSLY